jgi:hypothetical protein
VGKDLDGREKELKRRRMDVRMANHGGMQQRITHAAKSQLVSNHVDDRQLGRRRRLGSVDNFCDGVKEVCGPSGSSNSLHI